MINRENVAKNSVLEISNICSDDWGREVDCSTEPAQSAANVFSNDGERKPL